MDEMPLRFSADDGAIFVHRWPAAAPLKIERVELATGRRELVREVLPPDGVATLRRVFLSADARAHAYTYEEVSSNLFLAEGLR